MQVRIYSFSVDDKYKGYKLISYANINEVYEVMKTLEYMRQAEIPLIINTENMVDTDGEEFPIQSVNLVFPKVGGEINPYISVFVEDY